MSHLAPKDTLVKNGAIKQDGGWLMDVNIAEWGTAADLAAKAGYCPDGPISEIGMARMAEAEKAAAKPLSPPGGERLVVAGVLKCAA